MKEDSPSNGAGLQTALEGNDEPKDFHAPTGDVKKEDIIRCRVVLGTVIRAMMYFCPESRRFEAHSISFLVTLHLHTQSSSSSSVGRNRIHGVHVPQVPICHRRFEVWGVQPRVLAEKWYEIEPKSFLVPLTKGWLPHYQVRSYFIASTASLSLRYRISSEASVIN